VHLQAAGVRHGQEALVDQRTSAELQRHLGAPGLEPGQPGRPG
jgi:hypothetical protein